jgi:hypothetical protein
MLDKPFYHTMVITNDKYEGNLAMECPKYDRELITDWLLSTNMTPEGQIDMPSENRNHA